MQDSETKFGTSVASWIFNVSNFFFFLKNSVKSILNMYNYDYIYIQ